MNEVNEIPVKDVALGVPFNYKGNRDVSFMKIEENPDHLRIVLLHEMINYEYCLVVCLENYTIGYIDENTLVKIL